METKEIITSENCNILNKKLDESGNLNELIAEAYVIFEKYIKDDNFTFRNKKMFFKTEIDSLTFRKQGFEHIITKDFQKSRIRLYEKNRVAHLPLIEDIIKQCCCGNCTAIKIFKDKKDICVWCKKIDFLIVLSERQNGYVLLTAYPVIYEHKRKALEKKANENGL